MKGISFEKVMFELKEFESIHHHYFVPDNYISRTGFELGRAVQAIKKIMSNEKTQLDELGFVWKEDQDFFEILITHLKRYKRIHGDYFVPVIYVTCDIFNEEFKLGEIVQQIRSGAIKLTSYEKARMDAIGFRY